MQLNRNARLVILAVVALTVLLIGYSIEQTIAHRGKIKVQILALPKDSQISLDGNHVRIGTLYLLPGSHKLVASRQYFQDDVKQINAKDVAGQTIYMLPAANSDQAQAWLFQHPDVQAAREAAGGAEEARNRQVMLNNYPFLKFLPKETLDYKIDYSTSEGQKLKLTITLYAIINGPADYSRYQAQVKQYKAEALSYLKSAGANPDKLDIQYIPNL